MAHSSAYLKVRLLLMHLLSSLDLGPMHSNRPLTEASGAELWQPWHPLLT